MNAPNPIMPSAVMVASEVPVTLPAKQQISSTSLEGQKQKRHLRERQSTNYNEDFIEFDSIELDERPIKRSKFSHERAVPSISASHLELETAWAVVVNAGESILDEEEDLLPAGTHEQIYVQVPFHYGFRARCACCSDHVCCTSAATPTFHLRHLCASCTKGHDVLPVILRAVFDTYAMSKHSKLGVPLSCPSLKVRNIVVSKWREDVSRYMSEKEAVAAVGWAHRPYAIAAWRFLHQTGYINYGVAPGVSGKQHTEQNPKGTVVVVGAGMAGNKCQM